MPILTKDSKKYLQKVLNIKKKHLGLSKFYDACDKLFPNAWDKQDKIPDINVLKFNNLNTIFDDYYLYSNIILYFPEVTIKGSGVSHNITDLYVKLEIEFNNYSSHYTRIKGIRSSRTVEELQGSYIHSHLPRGRGNSLTYFCLGDGPLNDLQHTIVKKDTTIEEYEYFLHLIKSYVSWESASGMPYKYIKDLGMSSVESQCPNYITEHLFNQYKFNNIKYKIKNNKIEVIPAPELEEEIFNNIKDTSYNTYLCTKNDAGEYVRQDHVEVAEWMTDLENEEVLTFKGESVKFKISNKQNIQNYEYNVPNPAITAGICKLLSNKLTEAQIKRSSIRQKHQISYTQESISSDTSLV